MTHYLQELGILFNVIDVTETKITNSGYVFEHVPTSLACGGVGLFVDETLSYSEKSFNRIFLGIVDRNFFCEEEKCYLWSDKPSTQFSRELSEILNSKRLSINIYFDRRELNMSLRRF